ncbi:MAG: glycosyltransferase [Syntrophobacteraceae bacterium]|jgi:glycosyltransferase involved in cell wall biosynthesis
MNLSDLLKITDGKMVLFITPSDADYIRNRQEINILQKSARHLDIIAPRDIHGVNPTGIMRILLTNLKVVAANIKKYDVIFIGGIPQLIVPFIQFRLRKKVLIIDFFISIYDTLVHDRQVLSPPNPLSRVLKMLDRKALTGADHVIVDTREHAAYFSGMFGVGSDKMTVMYLEADKQIYYPRNVARPRDLRDKFVVFFFGAMNPLQGAEVILESAGILEEHGSIVFIIIGPYEKIRNFGLYSKLKNVRFAARWLPQTEIAGYIATSDVCLAGHFNADVEKAARVIPGKAYSYLAMERPVILGDNPANRELFLTETKNVHFVKMGDPEALADKILELAGVRERG